MADETVSLELLIESGNTAKTLGDLKANFTKLNEEIEKVDQGSAEFRKLQKAITTTGSKVKNLELSLESLDKEQVATAIGGVAGGIGDITNALVLLGGSNENMEVMVNNITTAMAVSMGLKGAIEGASDGYKLFNRFLQANAVIMKVVAVASKVLKFALISIGIGALIIIIGTLISNLDTVKQTFKNIGNFLVKTFKPQVDAILWVFQKIGDYLLNKFSPIIKGVTKLLEEFGLKETETAKKVREANEVILKSYQDRSAELKKLQAIQTQTHNLSIAQMNRAMSLAKANGKDITELEREKLQLNIASAKIQQDLGIQAIKSLGDEMKMRVKLNTLSKEYNEEFQKSLEERKKTTIDNAEALKNSANALAVFEATILTNKANKGREAYQKRKELLDAENEERLNAIREQNIQEGLEQDKKDAEELERKRLAKLTADEWETEAEEIAEQEQADADAKEVSLQNEKDANELEAIKLQEEKKKALLINGLANSQTALNMLASLNSSFLDRDLARAGDNEAKKEQLRKASFEREKKLNIAKAVINGAQAVMQVLANTPPPLSYILASGTAVMTGLQIDAIKNSSYSGGGSSVSPSLSTGASTSSAGEGVGINPVSNTSTILGDNKVIVTETDITNTQNTVAVIEAQSKF